LAKENGPRGDAIRAPAWNEALKQSLRAVRNVQLFCAATTRGEIDVLVMKGAGNFAAELATKSSRGSAARQ
jgi:hypothetical protein